MCVGINSYLSGWLINILLAREMYFRYHIIIIIMHKEEGLGK